MFVVDYATILRNGRGFFERVYIIKEKKASAEQSDIDADSAEKLQHEDIKNAYICIEMTQQ